MTTQAAVVLMSKDEARRETAFLKKALGKVSGDLASLKERIAEDDRREIWRATGYRSMAGYITGALGMSKSNAYRTLDQVRVTLALGAGESVPRGTESDHLAAPSQREAARISAPLKQPRARKGPPSIDRYCDTIDQAIETLTQRFEDAGEDALAYLPNDQRRRLERTVEKATRFTEQFASALSEPVRQQDEWGAA